MRKDGLPVKKKFFARIAAFFLVLVLLFSAAPASHAADDSDVAALMKRFENCIRKPKSEDILEEPVHMTVRSRNGNYIYVLSAPNGYAINSVAEGTSIVVYAKQNGFVLGLVENSLIGGWISENRLADDETPVSDSYRIEVTPVPEPETASGLSFDELRALAGKAVSLPKGTEILETAEIRYVESTYGNCIYSLSAPYGEYLATVREGTKLTVYARFNNYSLAQTADGSIFGWMADQFLEPVSREGKPKPADTTGLPEGVYRPQKGDYQDEYRTMYVRSTYGYRIYIIADPTKAPEERAVIGYANEQEACTVIARRNGFLFVITESGQRGWVAAEYMVYEY